MITRRTATRLGGVLAVAAAAGSALPVRLARAATPGVTDGEILIGGVFALSGPVRLVSKPLEEGARSYFDQVNENGGVNGRKLRWLVEDDSYQPARALAGVKKLVERDGVFMVYLSFGAAVTKVVSDYCDASQVPLISFNAVSAGSGPYTYGLVSRYESDGESLIKFLLGGGRAKRVGYFYQNDDVGRSAKAGIDKGLRQLGGQLVADVGFEAGTADFQAQILKLRDANVDAVIAFSTGPNLASAIKTGARFGFKPVWATYGIADSQVMRSVLGPDIEGLYYVSEMINGDAPEAAEHARLMNRINPGARPEFTSMAGYAGARLLVDALARAGRDLTRDSFQKALQQTKKLEVGVMAPITLTNSDHEVTNRLRLYRWKDGKGAPLSDWEPTIN